jgi:hypothetical protein
MIIAVDFDGVLVEDRFPEIGPANECVVEAVRQLIEDGHEVVLWTSRVDGALEQAKEWCKEKGLHFTRVNEAAPSNLAKYKGMYHTEPRKIYADMYLDDKAVNPNRSIELQKLTKTDILNYVRWHLEDLRRANK